MLSELVCVNWAAILTLTSDKLNAVFGRFEEVAKKKKGGLDDDDLEILVSDQAGYVNEVWRVSGLQATTGLSGIPTATVKMMGPDGVEQYVSATGTGPETSQLRDKKFSGMGSDTDIITSSARAYVSALNKLLT